MAAFSSPTRSIEYALSQAAKVEARAAMEEVGHEAKDPRWEWVFAVLGWLVVQVALRPERWARELDRQASALLLREARDPNRRRPGLIEEVEFGESYPFRKPPTERFSGGSAAA